MKFAFVFFLSSDLCPLFFLEIVALRIEGFKAHKELHHGKQRPLLPCQSHEVIGERPAHYFAPSPALR